MKITVRFFLVLSFLFVTHRATAQQDNRTPKPGFFTMQQFKLVFGQGAKFNSLSDSVFVPILDELVKEGKLIGWGQLTHAWGDEWDNNFYFVTESHRAFLDFWEEYVSRLTKRFPGSFTALSATIEGHKDNLYTIRKSSLR